jgi:tRNA(fMet)-specific endonuclease VapC
MTYLLDTNACAELLNERDTPFALKLASVSSNEVRLCSVVNAELYHGAYKNNRRESNPDLLALLFQRFQSLPFDDMAAEQYGRLRTILQEQGTPIGSNDTLIVSIAAANNVTLIAHKTAEFGRVPGLQMEDWQA